MLSDRKLEGEWSGNILFNGGPRSKWFRRDSAYILQDDLHIPTLTVRETIQFAANTRLPEGTSKEAIEERIVSLLDILGLDHIQNSVVGDADSRGISGGQLKRLSIAVEIVSLPDVIFLDEPTSGLDSLIALEVMQAVRKLANQNRTVVSTIHQPSPLVFDLFDTVMLIAEGRMVYYGSVQQVVPYFTSLGYAYDLGENPAEYIIEISQNAKLSSTLGRMSVMELERQFLTSELVVQVNTQKFIAGVARTAIEGEQQDNKSKRLHATTKYTQFKMLIHRDLLSITRDTHAIVALVSKNFIVGLLIGIVFFQQVKVTTPLFNVYGVPEPEVTNISALIFFGMMHTMVSNAEAIPHLVTKSLVFRREINAFAYSVSPYWLSHVLTVIPLLLVGFMTFAVSTYFLVSFPLAFSYMFYFLTMMLLASLSSYYLAMAIAAYTNDQKLSLTIFPLCFLFLSTFAGYAIPVKDVSVVWKWATYVSYVRWAFQGLMNNQWGRYNSPEDNDGYHTVLDYYGFDNYNMYNSYWIMCFTIGVMVTLAYLAMRPQRSYLKKVTREQVMNIGMQEELVNPIYNTRLTESLTTAILTEGDEGGSMGHMGKDIEEGVVDDLSNADIDVNIPASVGVNISFKDINYTVHNIPVLHGVFGYIKGGEMCALMGSSGAGKSTLLDILANRKTMGNIEGTIYVNQFQLYHKDVDEAGTGGGVGEGKAGANALLPRLAGSKLSNAKYSNRVDIRKISAYVMQDNILYGTLTVYESLHYAALLRLPATMSSADKDERIRAIMRILGLSHISTSMIGSEAKRGISGGQKKRVSIGVEIIHLPDVIYLDEPTTGLDSLIAHEVISSIYRLTRFNRTVLCTIHQPSYKTFKLFHTVLVLSAGRVIYFGSTNKIKDYFTTMCATKYKYDDNFNPADFIIAVASNPATYAVDSSSTVSVETLSEQYRNSQLGQDCVSTLQELILINSHKASASGAMRGIATEEMYNTSLVYQVQVLIRRLALRKWRGRYVVLATSLR
ncbi:ATP-binding cassette domain-containing protein [archaeon]|nr:MAG: ATP-binding cassette domain-containing protein [archaeon]